MTPDFRAATWRYASEWSAIMVVSLAGSAMLRQWGVEVSTARAIGYGIALAGIGTLPAFFTVIKTLGPGTDAFMIRWLASMSVKLLGCTVLAGLVLWLDLLEMRGFLLALGGALPVFSLHQVARLVLLSDQVDAAGKAEDTDPRSR